MGYRVTYRPPMPVYTLYRPPVVQGPLETPVRSLSTEMLDRESQDAAGPRGERQEAADASMTESASVSASQPATVDPDALVFISEN